jgi:hypothetical protein
MLRSLPPALTPYFSNLLLILGAYDPRNFNSQVYISQSYADTNSIAFAEGIAQRNSNDMRRNASLQEELQAAHLAARLPIFSLLGAEMKLPRVTKDPGATTMEYVNTVLEVKWGRTAATVATIVAAQFVVIAVTLLFCRDVMLRDDTSFLSLIRLMRTAAVGLGGRSVDSGEAIAKGQEDVHLVYGAMSRGDGTYEVDLARPDSEKRAMLAEFPDGDYH